MKSKGVVTIASLVLCMAMLLPLAGCGTSGKEGYQKNPDLDTEKEITLRIASSREAWPEMDNVIAKFEMVYPNCTVVYEPMEEYGENLPLRLNQEERKIDIFSTSNISATTKYRGNALNLISEESAKILDLSGANPGLVRNFRDTAEENTQYAIPFGGEMRGMYVNTTLLSQYGLAVPTNREELLHCCEVLYDAGLVPLQSDAGSFAQQLLYPYICNSVVNGGNYEELYAAIESIQPGISEYFRDAYTFLYELVEKGYYDFERVRNETPYTFNGNEGKARDFLNIIPVAEDVYEKKDDVGGIAFITSTQAFGLDLAKAKSDYHSEIEYAFILSPVGADGGCAYLSPADGLAINNRSDHVDWALEFLNFFFTPEINKAFAEEAGKIPNTADALLRFDVPAERTCDVGQMTFSYAFYKTVTTLMCAGYTNTYPKKDFTADFLQEHLPDKIHDPGCLVPNVCVDKTRIDGVSMESLSAIQVIQPLRKQNITEFRLLVGGQRIVMTAEHYVIPMHLDPFVGLAAGHDDTPLCSYKVRQKLVSQKETGKIVQSKLLFIAILCGHIPASGASRIVDESI